MKKAQQDQQQFKQVLTQKDLLTPQEIQELQFQNAQAPDKDKPQDLLLFQQDKDKRLELQKEQQRRKKKQQREKLHKQLRKFIEAKHKVKITSQQQLKKEETQLLNIIETLPIQFQQKSLAKNRIEQQITKRKAKTKLCNLLRNIQPATVKTQQHAGQTQNDNISKIFNKEINPVMYENLSTTQKLIRIIPPLEKIYKIPHQQQTANDIMNTVKNVLLENVSKQEQTFSQLIRLVKKGAFPQSQMKKKQYTQQTRNLSNQLMKSNQDVSLELMIIIMLLGLGTSIHNKDIILIFNLIYILKKNNYLLWKALYDKTVAIVLKKATEFNLNPQLQKSEKLDIQLLTDVFKDFPNIYYDGGNPSYTIITNISKIKHMLKQLGFNDIVDMIDAKLSKLPLPIWIRRSMMD